MSRENVEIVRRIYDEFARPEAIRELYHPDFEMDAVDAAPDVGVIRGCDAMVEALRSNFEMFEDLHLEIDEVIHTDDEHVMIAMHDMGRMRGSDSEVRNHRFHLFAFRDGKIVRFSSYLDRNRALEAAGLSD
jgi:ketosteroid isomerase-like protein